MKTRYGKKMAAALLLMLPLFTLAQNTTPEVKEKLSNNNLLALLLIVVTVILAIVIAGMGRVLLHIGNLLLEKHREEKKGGNPVSTMVITGLLLLAAQVAVAQDVKPVTKVIPNYGGLSSTLFYTFVGVIGLELVAILTLWLLIRKLYADLKPAKQAVVVKKNPAFVRWWSRLDKKLFTRAVPVAAEADVMLDHDYDGIHELDNALPPWWKYGFYITIAVAVFYLYHFHVSGNGKNPTQEYAAEVQYAKEQKARYDELNKDKIDEEKVPMADAAGISYAQGLFNANCVSCHGDKGQGGAGPNLTDDYWIHKGSLNDIYQSIKHGYPDKGMQPWIQKFNPKEISQLASYIKTMRGTKPAGAKEPQGDLYVEEAKPASDTLAVKKDSLGIKTVKKDTLSVKK